MKRRIFSSITALALCLSLLPGTALAEGDGPVTITGTKDSGGPAVVLEEGKTYVADETTGGVKEAPADTSEPYLRYSAGVLYVYSVVQIEGTMAVTSDLALRLVGAAANARLDLVDNSPSLSTTLSLNGHTMTLDCYITLSVVSNPHAAVDSGTFVYAPYTGGGDFEQSANKIEIVSDTTAAAQNLTIKDAGDVTIQGNTSTGGVVEKLTVENSQVTVEQRDTSNTDPVVNNLTTDAPITVKKGSDDPEVMTPGGVTWKNGGAFTGTTLNTLTEATCYKADKGWIYYKPAAAVEPAVLTLDGVEDIHVIYCGNTPTKIVAKGVNNKALDIQAGTTPEVTVDTDGSLCAIVDVTTSGGVHEAIVYGNVSGLGSINGTSLPIPLTKLTFAPGATLTIPDGQYLLISYSPQLESGKIINNGEFTVQYTEGALSDFSEYIRSLNLTGSGKVVARKTPSGGGSYVESYYNNEGVSIKTPTRTLDLQLYIQNNLSEDKLATSGFKFDVDTKTLTLDGLSANEVILPDDTVTIEVIGASTIRTLSVNGSAIKTHPIFTGSAPLTVQQQINIAGGDTNALTVAEGATLIANGGISIGGSGVSNSVVTVNGTLTAKGGDSTALDAGSVKIGEKGTLNVSGARGVSLNGMPKRITVGNDAARWNEIFVMERGATFDADCTDGNIRIVNTSSFPPGFEAKDAFDFPEGYELGDCEPRFNGDNIDLFRISTNQVYTGSLSIHEHHNFAQSWTWNITEHWHDCGYNGCTVKGSLAAHVLGVQSDENGHWEACTQEGCGHRTPSVAHVYTDDQDVTCDVCGHRRHVVHNSFASEWSYDDVNHWKACTVPDCDEQDQFGPHTYDNDQDAACNDCGYVRSVAPLPPSGGGGGGSRERTYAVTLVRPAHGRVTADRVRAESGSTVTLTAVADAGYTLQSLTATDGQGEAVGVREGADGRFTFTMPNRAVTVEAVFAPLPAAESPSVCTGGAGCPSGAFPDLSAGKWYHEAVDYVLREGLMDGQGGLFHPNGALTRGMLAQILYNKEGRPPVNGASGFPDVAPGAWYADAVTWAASKGIVSGHADGRFAPTDSITREQLAVMLWRYAGSPSPGTRDLRFTDAESVSAYARDALAWAVEQGIVSGMGGGQLSPKGEATRAQAAQMLKNFLEK